MPKQLTFFTIQYKREFTLETEAGHRLLTKWLQRKFLWLKFNENLSWFD